MDRIALKAKLKAYEKSFKDENGRNPTPADIKLNPAIAKDYKSYNASKSKSIPPPVILPPRAATPPRKITPLAPVPLLPADPKAWERVFNIEQAQTLPPAIEDDFGPSPVKPSASGQPFVPLFMEERSIASGSNSNLYSQFKASTVKKDQELLNGQKSNLVGAVRGIKRLADDPEKKDFNFELPVKEGKKSKYENSDGEKRDDEAIGYVRNGKGKGKGKAVVSKTKGKVVKKVAGKKVKKSKLVESDDDDMTEIVREAPGIRTRKTKDEKGRIVLELEFGDDEEEEEDQGDYGNLVLDGDGDTVEAVKPKKEKITLHPRRPYHDDSKSATNATKKSTGTRSDLDEEELRDSTTLFYRDSFDLIDSQSVFAQPGTPPSQPVEYNSSDEDDNPPSPSDLNLSPKKKSISYLDDDSLDPLLLDLLTLRSPSKKQSIAREKERDLVVKHLLMEPLERSRNTKRADGLEELIFSERREKGLGVRLGEVEVEEEEDDWASEVEGWKIEDFDGRMDNDSAEDGRDD